MHGEYAPDVLDEKQVSCAAFSQTRLVCLFLNASKNQFTCEAKPSLSISLNLCRDD